ncbi:MAG: RdgB/HAM1 family non-canonical purine NTP pyrophosphatase [Candidatus Marinimicrobia bacterium]|nr:non-canonical purine NTP pyrophosphatase, RdgB/HAM1 family [Candidatus Neomarinimicrobiota bacterium]MDP6568341.1 RdgB/HAM1 family non-canonical purine NTP pyrophosphatase [Candidatus Neomarinimicrobiota bacterium]MDP7061163.1 RdgB/HAM1 family non-canonical purine NTP pyrophosphatase [Candidatus Neomarinimicrobiota bacterium]
MMKIVIATRNRHKAVELQTLLHGVGYDAVRLDEIDPDGKIPEVEETGTTFKENAFLKAHAIAKATDLPSVADDTGLEVDALGGAPGIFSARYSGENCTYEDNVKKLLNELSDVADDRRTARFKTVAVYVHKETELSAEGVVEGVITEKAEGFGGFGYDPVFSVWDMKKTYAQLADEEKNRVSHRGKAIRSLIEKLHENGLIADNPS